MLQNRQHASVEQPVANGATNVGDQLRVIAKRSIANHFAGLRCRYVENRQAIDGDPDLAEIGSNEAAVKPSRPAPGFDILQGKTTENPARRIGKPSWWAKPLDTAPFLVDENRRIITADQFAEV